MSTPLKYPPILLLIFELAARQKRAYATVSLKKSFSFVRGLVCDRAILFLCFDRDTLQQSPFLQKGQVNMKLLEAQITAVHDVCFSCSVVGCTQNAGYDIHSTSMQ